MSPADIKPSIGGMGAAWLTVFALGLVTFAVGWVISAILFDAKGVPIFMASLVLAKPVLDLTYFAIQMLIIDKVSEIEHLNLYTYIFNHELGLFAARSIGCGLFILLATYVSPVPALKLASPIIAVLQVTSILVACNTVSSVATVGIGPFKSHPEIVEVVGR